MHGSGRTSSETCIKCGEVVTESQEIPTLGHEIVTVDGIAPTCTEAGRTASEMCAKCGEVMTEPQEIPALGHTRAASDIIPPTCERTGNGVSVICSVCDELLVEATQIPKRHTLLLMETGNVRIAARMTIRSDIIPLM